MQYSYSPGPGGLSQATQTVTESPAERHLREISQQQSTALGQLGIEQTGKVSDILSQPYQSIRTNIAGALGQANYGSPLGNVSAPTTDLASALGGPANFGSALSDVSAPGRNLQNDLGGPANYGDNIGDVSAQTAQGGRLDLGQYNQAGLSGLNLSQYDSANVGQMRNYLTDLAVKPLQKQFDQREESLRSRLANQGVNAGTEAFGSELSAFNEGAGNAYAAAQLNAFNSALGANAQDAGLRLQERNDQRGRLSNDAGMRTQEAGFNRGTDQFNAGARERADASNFQRWQANAGLNQAEREQGLSEALAQQGIDMEGAQFAAGENRARAGFNTGLAQSTRQQQLAEALGQQNINSQAFDANSANELSRAGFNTNLAQSQRQQQLAELLQQNTLDNQYGLADRQTPLGEINALMNNTQLNPIVPGQAAGVNMASTDIAGLINQNYQNQAGLYNTKMTSRNALLGSLAGLGGSALGAGMFKGFG